MSVLDTVRTVLVRRYLFVRQQGRHLQAGLAYLRGHPLPRTRVVLFGRGRSGTTALVSLLDEVPGVRCEGEILRNAVPFPYRHVLGRAARCEASTYGCKILSYQVRDVQRFPGRQEDLLRTLHREHGFHILYLRRTNRLRHALSNIRARRDTFHRKTSDPDPGPTALLVDPDHVIEWMQRSEALHAYEQRLLNDVPCLSLTYEEHLRHADAHQSTVDAICDYVGIDSGPVESSYQKTAPASLRDRVANYDELAARLTGTRYESYLE